MTAQEIKTVFEAKIAEMINAEVEVTFLTNGFSVAGHPAHVTKAIDFLAAGFTYTGCDSIPEDPDYAVAFFTN